MSKPITHEQVELFREFCREQIAENEDGCFYVNGSDIAGLFGDENGDQWQYSPDGDETHDIMELFGEVADEFCVEEDGWDSFCVSFQEN